MDLGSRISVCAGQISREYLSCYKVEPRGSEFRINEINQISSTALAKSIAGADLLIWRDFSFTPTSSIYLRKLVGPWAAKDKAADRSRA